MKNIDEIKEKIRESEKQISDILNKLKEDIGDQVHIASIDTVVSIGGRLHAKITCSI
jgi:hypothetical protein